ncbi:MAG: PilC/PilY family type IV pilus protein, partial [Phycisphaeraceae bacterium]
YQHTYYVDGPITAEDAYFGAAWHSVVVLGLGAGGKGYSALDVTSAAVASDADAQAKVLWEFTSGSVGAANLGYGYSRASVVRLNNNQWAAVVGNGYLSTTEVASLLILDIQTGSVIREIVVPDAAANGLSSPTLIDTNADFKADLAYAGDLNGNVWKFDLSSTSPGSWDATLLFQTDNASGTRQPITTAPVVGLHPDQGYMVYVGTGRLLSSTDALDKTQQAVYGLWDNDWVSGLPINPALLVTQQLRKATHASAGTVRTATAYSPDWTVHRGWKMPAEVVGATSLDQGERVVQDLVLRDKRVQFMLINPTLPTGDNWYIQLNADTGGAPTKIILDVTDDFVLNLADNADGNGDLVVEDVPEDRVVGQYQSFGLASQPVIGKTGALTSAALINHLQAINPADGSDPTDPGLLGGHFDLDTSHDIFPFAGELTFPDGTPVCDGNGLPLGCAAIDTDAHEHQWDDQFDATTIDYFNVLGSPFDVDDSQNGVTNRKTKFLISVGNTALSPGGVLEINGASISVGDYRAVEKRYLAGALLPGEEFPVYQMDPTSPAEAAAGVKRLTSFKLSFDAFAILSGDLMPTQTSCVKGNVAGALGEYRNGALLVQALAVDPNNQTFVYNAATDTYVGSQSSVHATNGHATAGLEWESTVFWHWDGPCYGEPEFDQVFNDCVILQIITCTQEIKSEEAEEKAKDKKKDEDDDDDPWVPDPGDPPPVPVDPDQTISSTAIADDNDTGRLFWTELLPLN